MAPRPKPNVSTASTTWLYSAERIAAVPAGRQGSAKLRRWGRLRRRSPRDKLTLTIQYKGGSGAWYLIEARGSSGVFPGVAALHDVMREINNVHD